MWYNWMREDFLWLNDEKTEFLLVGSRQQPTKVSINSIKFGEADVARVYSARNLGALFDSYLDMSTHIPKTCGSASYYLYNILYIRKFLSREHTEQLVHSFITSRLDYCNSLLYGVPDCLFTARQSFVIPPQLSWSCTGCKCMRALNLKFLLLPLKLLRV